MSSVVATVDVVSIPVRDQDRAKSFYCETLGFKLVADNQISDGMRWVQVAPPDSETSFTLVTWFEKMQPGSLRGVVLRTPDIDRAHAHLRASGVDVDPIEDAPWGRHATFGDPDGNGFVLRQAP